MMEEDEGPVRKRARLEKLVLDTLGITNCATTSTNCRPRSPGWRPTSTANRATAALPMHSSASPDGI